MEEKLINLMWDVKEGKKHPNRAFKEICKLFGNTEDVLDVPDIRNKLGPITFLIDVIEENGKEWIKKVVPSAKKSVNYLAQMEIYHE